MTALTRVGASITVVVVSLSLSSGSVADTRAGGVLRLASVAGPDFVDPAFTLSDEGVAILSATCLKLLNYPDAEGAAGSKLVPEAAEAMPRVSADGRTYTFTIRRGLRFSDGKPLTAANYEEAAYRLFNPRMNSFALTSGGADDVLGIADFKAGKTKRLVGVRASGRALTVRLVRPNPDILNRVAMTFVCPVPIGYPLDPTGVEDPPLPGSGPYYIASHRVGAEIVLRRNPYYRGSRPRRVDEIRIAIGGSRAENATAVERGELDYAFDGPPDERVPELIRRYGVDRGRLWLRTRPSTTYLALNTSRPLFRDNPRLRRAVNFALDRREYIRQAGSAHAGRPTDQLLPPSMPGFRDAHLYPVDGPALQVAKRLARGSLRSGKARLYFTNAPLVERRARIIQYNLAQIGLDVELHPVAADVLIFLLSRPGEPYDLALANWGQDFPDPANFLISILHGRSIPTGPPPSLAFFTTHRNLSRLRSTALDAALDRASKLFGEARYRAFARIEVDALRTLAPIAPIAHRNDYILVSDRVGCVVYSPVFKLDLAALCVK